MADLIPVAIGAGHSYQGYDSGAVAPDGTTEAELAYCVAQHLNEMLRKDGRFNVLLIDHKLPLEQRAAAANNFNAEIFVELHFNNFTDKSANGTEALDYDGSGEGGKFSNSFTRIMAEREGLKNRGVKHTGRTFANIRNTINDAVIVEYGFLSNSSDYSHFDEPFELRELAYWTYLCFPETFNLQPKPEIDPYYKKAASYYFVVGAFNEEKKNAYQAELNQKGYWHVVVDKYPL